MEEDEKKARAEDNNINHEHNFCALFLRLLRAEEKIETGKVFWAMNNKNNISSSSE